jgi:hypothetical protein
VILFLFNFLVLDCFLSNQFIRWPIISPHSFFAFDRLIWKLNWSQPGKFLNTGPFTLLKLIVECPVVPTIVISLVIGLKPFSICRLQFRYSPPAPMLPQEELDATFWSFPSADCSRTAQHASIIVGRGETVSPPVAILFQGSKAVELLCTY